MTTEDCEERQGWVGDNVHLGPAGWYSNYGMLFHEEDPRRRDEISYRAGACAQELIFTDVV